MFSKFKMNENELIKNYIIKLKKNLSKLDNNLILFDIRSKNIYLITDENIYSRISIQDYRFPDNALFNLFKKTLQELEIIQEQKKIKNIDLDISKEKIINLTDDEIYIEKLKKNINILSCFDLKILKLTYYKLFYKSSYIGKELTTCVKPSYISKYKNNNVLTKNEKINPYYSTSELIN